MWLKNLAIVLQDNTIQDGEIAIEDGFITEIRTNGNGGSKAVNNSGLIAIPGLVDIHGDMIEREIEPRPKSRVPVEMALLELDKRLAATGITTSFAAISFADFGGMSDSTESLRAEDVARQIAEVVSQMQPHLRTTMLIHARFEVTHPAAIPVIAKLATTGEADVRLAAHYVGIMGRLETEAGASG